MKQTILLAAIALLFSCKKTNDSGKPLPHEEIAATANQAIAPVTVYYNFKYSYLGKSMTLLCSYKLVGNISTLVLTNTAGDITYFKCNHDETTLLTFNIEMPNIIPFNNILPPGSNQSWASCMKNAIKKCATFPLCANGTCRGEAIVGCLSTWSVVCLWYSNIPVPEPLIILNPHPF